MKNDFQKDPIKDTTYARIAMYGHSRTGIVHVVIMISRKKKDFLEKKIEMIQIKIKTLFMRNPYNPNLVTSIINPDCKWVVENKGTPTRFFDGIPVMRRYDKNKKKNIYYKEHARLRTIEGDWEEEPEGWIPCDKDEDAGFWYGWIPIDFDDPRNWKYKEARDNKFIPRGILMFDTETGESKKIPPTCTVIASANPKESRIYHTPSLHRFNQSKQWYPPSPMDVRFDVIPFNKEIVFDLCGTHVNGNPEGLDSHYFIPRGEHELDFNFLPKMYTVSPYVQLKEWFKGKDIEGIVWYDKRIVTKLPKTMRKLEINFKRDREMVMVKKSHCGLSRME